MERSRIARRKNWRSYVANCGCNAHGSFLTAKGLKEAEQRSAGAFVFDGVDKRQLSLYLDKVGSVSALVEGEEDHVFDDHVLEEQFRRHSYGS